MHDRDPDPLDVVGAIRNSFQDAAFVYTNGSCFELYKILKTIFPQARAWWNMGHVWTEINGQFYDIHGHRAKGADGLSPMDEEPLKFERAHRWSAGTRWRIDAAVIEEEKRL